MPKNFVLLVFVSFCPLFVHNIYQGGSDMKQMYPVSVFSSGEFSRKSRKRLSGYGLIWDGVEFFGIVGEKTLHKIKKYCSLHKYRFRIENNLGRRGSDYRRRYFIMNKPVIGDKYICVYCGKLLTKDELTVDHIYPIGKASNSLKYQKKLSRKGIKNINDGKNLVSACAKCNALKSADTGLWILKSEDRTYLSFMDSKISVPSDYYSCRSHYADLSVAAV
jgi:HNH endonuclease.